MNQTYRSTIATQGASRRSMPAVAGALAGLALAAGWMIVRAQQRSRRYTDHAAERRSPMSLFLPMAQPRRRAIDRSGRHPLFERRQSVYDAY